MGLSSPEWEARIPCEDGKGRIKKSGNGRLWLCAVFRSERWPKSLLIWWIGVKRRELAFRVHTRTRDTHAKGSHEQT